MPQELGARPVVFDTGKRAPGGRASSRTLSLDLPRGQAVRLRVDHAAQYFVATSPDFSARVAAWRDAGAVREWGQRIVDIRMAAGGHGAGGSDGAVSTSDAAVEHAWIGADGMGSVWQHVASKLRVPVRTGQWVGSVSRAGGAWRLCDARVAH